MTIPDPSLVESLAVGGVLFGSFIGAMFTLTARRLNQPPRHRTPTRRHRFTGDDK